METSNIDISMLKVDSDLPTDGLPTVLDIVKFARKICEEEKNKQNKQIGIIGNRTVEAVWNRWKTVFPLFQLCMFESEKELRRKIKVILQDADDVRRGRAPRAKVEL